MAYSTLDMNVSYLSDRLAVRICADREMRGAFEAARRQKDRLLHDIDRMIAVGGSQEMIRSFQQWRTSTVEHFDRCFQKLLNDRNENERQIAVLYAMLHDVVSLAMRPN